MIYSVIISCPYCVSKNIEPNQYNVYLFTYNEIEHSHGKRINDFKVTGDYDRIIINMRYPVYLQCVILPNVNGSYNNVFINDKDKTISESYIDFTDSKEFNQYLADFYEKYSDLIMFI